MNTEIKECTKQALEYSEERETCKVPYFKCSNLQKDLSIITDVLQSSFAAAKSTVKPTA